MFGPSMKSNILSLLLAVFILSSTPVIAKNSNTDSRTSISEGELAQLLAPIALYPDTLLTHILIASTYPIEVIEAHRWLDNHDQLSNDEVANKVANKDWDPSVKALMPFPNILKRLNDDLSWTNQLGDAFLDDEAQVLSSIQQLRLQADEAGNLEKMDNMAISYDNNNIVIQPRQPEVVYVPYYDTRTIYGGWSWGYYPPVYWVQPHHYISYKPYYWHSGVHISFNYFFNAFQWQSRRLVVINHHNSHRYKNRHRITSSVGSKRWHHKPHHRRGVAYSNNHVKNRFKSNRISTSQAKKNRQFQHKKMVQQTRKKGYKSHQAMTSAKHQKTREHLAKSSYVKQNKKRDYRDIQQVNRTAKRSTHSKKVLSHNKVSQTKQTKDRNVNLAPNKGHKLAQHQSAHKAGASFNAHQKTIRKNTQPKQHSQHKTSNKSLHRTQTKQRNNTHKSSNKSYSKRSKD